MSDNNHHPGSRPAKPRPEGHHQLLSAIARASVHSGQGAGRAGSNRQPFVLNPPVQYRDGGRVLSWTWKERLRHVGVRIDTGQNMAPPLNKVTGQSDPTSLQYWWDNCYVLWLDVGQAKVGEFDFQAYQCAYLYRRMTLS